MDVQRYLPAGAHANALIYSLVETARANGQEPYVWLRQLLRALPGAQTVEAVEALLPWNLHLANLHSTITSRKPDEILRGDAVESDVDGKPVRQRKHARALSEQGTSGPSRTAAMKTASD